MKRGKSKKIARIAKYGKKFKKLKKLKDLETEEKLYLAGNLLGIALILATPADSYSKEVFELFDILLD